MGLEAATYINELNPAWPLPNDFIREADDHMRLIKQTVLNTFPNVTGEVTASDGELNLLVGQTFFPGPGGLDTYVQFKTGGAFSGSSELVFDGTLLTANSLAVVNTATFTGDTEVTSGNSFFEVKASGGIYGESDQSVFWLAPDVIFESDSITIGATNVTVLLSNEFAGNISGPTLTAGSTTRTDLYLRNDLGSVPDGSLSTTSGPTVGLRNADDEWVIQGSQNAETILYYNGLAQAETLVDGWYVYDKLQIEGSINYYAGLGTYNEGDILSWNATLSQFDVRVNPGGGGAIGGSIADNQIAVGAATANEIEGNASFTFDASTNELRLGTQVTGRIEMGGTAESIRWNNTLDTIDIYQDSQIVIGISGTQDVAMPWGNLRVGGTSAVNGVVSVRSSAATDALVDFYNGTTKYAELRLDNANLDLDIRTQVAGAEVAVYSGLGFEAMRWHGTNGDTAMGGYLTQYNGGTPTDTHVLTWVTANGRAEFIAAGGGGGTPGGADTQFQYNNGGVFGGIAEFTYNDGNPTTADLFSLTKNAALTTGSMLNAVSNNTTHTGAVARLAQEHASGTAIPLIIDQENGFSAAGVPAIDFTDGALISVFGGTESIRFIAGGIQFRPSLNNTSRYTIEPQFGFLSPSFNKTSDTTLADVPDLVLDTESAHFYEVDIWLYWSSGQDAKVNFDMKSSGAGFSGSLRATATIFDNAGVRQEAVSYSGGVGTGLDTGDIVVDLQSNDGWVHIQGMIDMFTGGIWQLQAAQNTSVAVQTRMGIGSYMKFNSITSIVQRITK